MRPSDQPRHTYEPKGRGWAVYRWDYAPGGSAWGTNVAEFDTREEARRECYRLNGWRYVESKKKPCNGRP